MILSKWLTGFTETLTRSRHSNGRGHRRRPQMQHVLRPSDLAKRVDALEDRCLLAVNILNVEGTAENGAASFVGYMHVDTETWMHCPTCRSTKTRPSRR